MNKTSRGHFSTRLGIILATAGSAVGLGNVWRFPFVAGQNGGAAFILVYIACIFLLGIPGMLSEFVIGRRTQRNAARAYRNFSRNRVWRFVGYLGILTSIIILGFYAVVAGWCLQYLFASLAGTLSGDTDYVRKYFIEFYTDPWMPTLWGVAFILATHLVVVRGVEKGIERASKILMPVLLILLLVIVVASCLLPGATAGIAFLLKPDFSHLHSSSLLEALGQAFFSLSLGTACLCTYASYFSKETNLVRSATQIALIDTVIAILAGLMIFPAAASVGVEPDAGPSLVFITLPNVFQQAFAAVPLLGRVVSILFYALLVFAALTSTISMHEIGTAFFSEERRLPRRRAAWVVTAVCSTIAVFCSLGNGALSSVTLFGSDILSFCDDLTAQFMLPTGALFTSIFIGWYASQDIVRRELTSGGRYANGFFRAYQVAVRFVVPLCIALIFMHQFGVI